MSHPKFAVVGHPNKGKSSIVAALSLDDTVAISDIPGTTLKKRSYALRVDNKTLYELYDTPGFQRARKALAWLQEHASQYNTRADTVRAFVREHKSNPKFQDEIELLEPILDGAGIIYVIDASKPYSKEYEAEMEILRWCNQPSMALMNHIEEDDYRDEWQDALGYYFKLIRSYNPMRAGYKEHITILESMAHLNEAWIDDVKASLELFRAFWKQMIHKSATTIIALLKKSMQHKKQIAITTPTLTQEQKTAVELQYKNELKSFEEQAFEKLKKIWNYKALQTQHTLLLLDDIDLFSKESESIFGLTKKELLITATTSGALTGASIDLLFGGHTAFIGAITGAAVGGAGAYFGFDELADIKLLGKRIAKHTVEIGPMKNPNFAYVLLLRSLFLTLSLLERSHARREKLQLSMNESTFKEQILTKERTKAFESFFRKLRSKKGVTKEDEMHAQKIIEEILLHYLED
jgi:hypothetical protein